MVLNSTHDGRHLAEDICDLGFSLEPCLVPKSRYFLRGQHLDGAVQHLNKVCRNVPGWLAFSFKELMLKRHAWPGCCTFSCHTHIWIYRSYPYRQIKHVEALSIYKIPIETCVPQLCSSLGGDPVGHAESSTASSWV